MDRPRVCPIDRSLLRTQTQVAESQEFRLILYFYYVLSQN